jgi:hypothetical protein
MTRLPPDEEMPMSDVQGTCDPRFEGLRAAFQQNIDTGEELDLVLGVPLRWGIGYGLPQAERIDAG